MRVLGVSLFTICSVLVLIAQGSPHGVGFTLSQLRVSDTQVDFGEEYGGVNGEWQYHHYHRQREHLQSLFVSWKGENIEKLIME